MKKHSLIQSVSIVVHTPDNSKAIEVSLKESGNRSFIPLQHIDECTYRCAVSKLGVHTIKVKAKGFETQERRVKFPFPEEQIDFYLSVSGTEYVYLNGAKVPKPKIDLSSLIIIPFETREKDASKRQKNRKNLMKELENLTDPAEQSNAKKGKKQDEKEANLREDRLFFNKNFSKKERRQKLSEIRKHPEVAEVGFSVLKPDGGTTVMLNELFVGFTDDLPTEQIHLVLSGYPLKSYVKLPYGVNYYNLYCTDETGEEIFELLEELNLRDDVVFANLSFLEPAPTNSITPNDFYWHAQWDKHLMQVGDAWEKLCDEFDESKQFGDRGITVAVLDRGIKTNGGAADNIDFQDESDMPQGTITSTINPPRATITVQSSAGFSVGDKIAIGTEQNLEIHSISGEQFEVDAILLDHQQYAEITNLNDLSIFTFLESDVTATTSELTVSMTTGTFSIGAVVSLEALTSVYWEDLIIKDIQGTTITTTPIRQAHSSGTIIVQQRKLHRVFDFQYSSGISYFGPDNDYITSNHGIACAGVTAGKANNGIGAAGVAPNVRLIGINNGKYQSTDDLVHPKGVLREFLWSAGLIDYEYPETAIINPPNRLVKGADILTCSIGFGQGTEVYDDLSHDDNGVKRGFSKLVRRGRNGRGALVFFAAGNDWKTMLNSNWWCSHPEIMAISASTLKYDQPHPPAEGTTIETLSGYSNIGNNSTTRIAFAAPSNISFSGESTTYYWSDKVNPHHLGIITASETGYGNLTNNGVNECYVTTDFIVPRSTLDGDHVATWNYIKLPVGTDFNQFPNDCWVKIGDTEASYSEDWFQVINADEPNNKLNLTKQLGKAYKDDTIVARIPAQTSLKYSILPGATVIHLKDTIGFNANDWIRLGQGKERTEIRWVQIASVNHTAKTFTLTSALTDIFQCFGKDEKEDKDFVIATSADSGDTYIDINLSASSFSSWMAENQAIEITNNEGTTSWHIITGHSDGEIKHPPSPAPAYTSCRLSISPALPEDANVNKTVFVPKVNGAPSVIGSSIIEVNDAFDFTTETWAYIGTPTDGTNMISPRLETTHIHETLEEGCTKMRISGPNYAYPENTKIYQGASNDFQDRFGGTSAATPQVAGVAALVLSANPNLTWVEVREVLRKSAVRILNDTTWLGLVSDYASDMDYKFSDEYGFGRVNASVAVQEAIALREENDRDLYLRNYLIFHPDGTVSEDDGITATDLSLYKIHSPDIWVRNESSFDDDGKLPEVKHYSTELPPNQNLTIDDQRMIYIRIKNRSEDKESLQSWVRAYLLLTSGIPDLAFPQYFDDETAHADYLVGKTGIYYLNQQQLFSVIPGTDNVSYELHKMGGIRNNTFSGDSTGIEFGPFIAGIPWSSEIKPPVGTFKHTYVVAEILPYDGPLVNLSVDSNSNISYRRVLFTEVRFFKGTSSDTLEKVIKYDEIEPEKEFTITVRDIEYLPVKHIRIVAEFTMASGTTKLAEFKHNGTTFAFTSEDHENILIDQPVETSGSPDLFTFEGTLILAPDILNVELKVVVMEPDIAEENPTTPVKPLVIRDEIKHSITVYSLPNYEVNSEEGMAPSKTPRPFVFADFDKMSIQSDVDQGFTVVSSTAFHVTSLFKANTPGDTVNAYAPFTCQVFLQKADNNRVNLMLRPFEQSGNGANQVKYFVYRGLKLTDFLSGPGDPADKVVRSRTGASEFIESLYAGIDSINNATTPAGTATLSPKAFGYDPEKQLNPEQEIDDFFFNPDNDHQLAIATKGMVLGTFVNDGVTTFGFEIIVADGKFYPDLEYARATDFTLTVPEASETYSTWMVRSEKEKVLSFIDPAAYIGGHYFTGINVPSSETPIEGAGLLTGLLDRFYTKSCLYFDIRNSSNLSYSFEENYRGPIVPPGLSVDLKIMDNEGSFYGRQYLEETSSEILVGAVPQHDWPVISFKRPSSKDSEIGLLYFKLRISDNTTPVIYIQNGIVTSSKTNERFIDSGILIDENDAAFTKGVGFMWPLLNTNQFVSGQIKLHYGRRLPSGEDLANRAMKIEHYHDNVFGSLNGAMQKRSILSIDAITKTITLNGDYRNNIRIDDIVKIEGAVETGNNKLYTVNVISYNETTLKTTVTVDESISDSSDPLGKLVFTYHFWNTELPSKWFSGTRRMFIDSTQAPLGTDEKPLLGFACMADAGIAFDNNRVVFFASPVHYLKRAEDRAVKRINMNGGIDSSESFWVAVEKLNTDLQLSASVLKIAADEYFPVFEFEQAGTEDAADKKENFLALCFSELEFNQIKQALFESNLVASHEQFLRLKLIDELVDLNGIEYTKYAIYITGWSSTGVNEVVYTEIPSSTTVDPYPVYVYTLKNNPLIFSSKDYAVLEDTLIKEKKYDEELRIEPTALSAMTSDVDISTLVYDFQSDFISILDDNVQIENLVVSTSKLLFQSAVAGATDYDDRALYWSRLHLRATIRSHEWTKKQRELMQKFIDQEEGWSRGILSIDFSDLNPAFSLVNVETAKKILVVGFDPLGINKTSGNLAASSRSAIVALNLHDKVIESDNNTGIIQSVVLSGRYKDFQSESVQNLIHDSLVGDHAVDMVILLNDNAQPERFDVERYAAKAVSQTMDNELVKQKSASRMGPSPFYSTNLPTANMVVIAETPRVYYDQSFQFSDATQTHPAEGGPDVNTDLDTVLPSGTPKAGSAGDELTNYYYYHFLRYQQKKNSLSRIGMISLPQPGGTWNNFTTIINRLTTLLSRGLDNL